MLHDVLTAPVVMVSTCMASPLLCVCGDHMDAGVAGRTTSPDWHVSPYLVKYDRRHGDLSL